VLLLPIQYLIQYTVDTPMLVLHFLQRPKFLICHRGNTCAGMLLLLASVERGTRTRFLCQPCTLACIALKQQILSKKPESVAFCMGST
jgi:hypothetical protein